MAKGDLWEAQSTFIYGQFKIAQFSVLEETGQSKHFTHEYDVIVSEAGRPDWIATISMQCLMGACRRINTLPIAPQVIPPAPMVTSQINIVQALLDAMNQASGVFVGQSKIRCECGADSCGHPGHSTWCPKHQ